MKNRLLALDVFRGMTIFFMIVVNSPGAWSHVYPPLLHAKWDGLTPTDLVFPFFVFIVGGAMSFSFLKYEELDQSGWIRKVLKRTALIFLVGLALNWFPFFNKSFSDLRVFGVLQRIALAYGIGSLLVIFIRTKLIPLAFLVLLLGYYGLLHLFGSGDALSLETNAVRILDLWLVGEQHMYGGYGLPFDPEGLLGALPAAATVLYGYWVGRTIQTGTTIKEKMKNLLPYGIGGIALGITWHFAGFPINKPLWSSSYVLVTGGLAVFFLIVLLWILDEKGWRSWAYIFKAFGLNPLISYVLSGIILKTFFLIKIGEENVYSWLYSTVFQNIGPMLGSFLQALAYALFIWLFAAGMYRRNIIVKL